MATCQEKESLTVVESGIISLFKNYVNTLYYLGLCPTKIISKSAEYNYTRWWPQALFSVIPTTVLVMYLLGMSNSIYLRGSWTSGSSFEIFHLLFTIVQVLAIQYSFWAHSQDFVDVINFVANSNKSKLPLPSIKWVSRVKILTLCAATGIICFSMITCLILRYQEADRNWNVIWVNIVQEGRSAFLFQNSPVLKQSNFTHAELLSGALVITVTWYS